MLRLYTHPDCLRHDPGAGHAEQPARLRAVLHALEHDRFAALDRVEAPPPAASSCFACTTPVTSIASWPAHRPRALLDWMRTP